MKNRNLLFSMMLLLMAATLISCEKMVIDDEEEQAANVSDANLVLRVVGSNAQTMTTRAAADYWTRLNFVAYQNGSKVQAVSQTADDDGFGEAGMKLAAGTYQILVLAHSAKNNPTLSDPEKIQFTNADGFTDTFCYYGDVTVTNESKRHDITLERVTAKVRFTINEDMPSNVSSIRFYYTGGSGALNAKTGLGCVASQQSVFFDVDPSAGKPYTFEVYTIPREQTGSLNLTVTTYTSKDNIVKAREFKGVPVECNKITEMAGSFFTDEPTPDPGGDEKGNDTFVITANTEWAGTITYSF